MYNLHDYKMKITLFFIFHFILLIHLPAKSQQMNQIIDDPVRHRPVLIDQVDRSALLTGEIGQFFQDDYNSYQPDSAAINNLKQKTKNLRSYPIMFSPEQTAGRFLSNILTKKSVNSVRLMNFRELLNLLKTGIR